MKKIVEFVDVFNWGHRNMDILGPIVDRLVATDCRWWTIELEDTLDVLNTRRLFTDHFETAKCTEFRRPKACLPCRRVAAPLCRIKSY